MCPAVGPERRSQEAVGATSAVPGGSTREVAGGVAGSWGPTRLEEGAGPGPGRLPSKRRPAAAWEARSSTTRSAVEISPVGSLSTTSTAPNGATAEAARARRIRYGIMGEAGLVASLSCSSYPWHCQVDPPGPWIPPADGCTFGA